MSFSLATGCCVSCDVQVTLGCYFGSGELHVAYGCITHTLIIHAIRQSWFVLNLVMRVVSPNLKNMKKKKWTFSLRITSNAHVYIHALQFYELSKKTRVYTLKSTTDSLPTLHGCFLGHNPTIVSIGYCLFLVRATFLHSINFCHKSKKKVDYLTTFLSPV